jgi:hypothetical protein
MIMVFEGGEVGHGDVRARRGIHQREGIAPDVYPD